MQFPALTYVSEKLMSLSKGFQVKPYLQKGMYARHYITSTIQIQQLNNEVKRLHAEKKTLQRSCFTYQSFSVDEVKRFTGI